MNPHPERAEELFAVALEHGDANGRCAFLDQACGSNAALRQEVESLIEAHEASGEFLKVTSAEAARPLPSFEKAGDRIGRYKLLEQIGEGGFGVVWMAEQEEPVRRRLALKIIKLGMDTKEVVARFEAERQALAMMDHPNIASVFDGGATDTGRPYFVMELVKGIPITQFCDERKLTTRERLELFTQVCQAVQHAHQKGIIHRDIKPTNVLVTVKDDRPVPKVIDFGVAKATQARLTEKTLFTRFQQWIGTPAYMSPEQAGLGSLDVDTRSDVYSLGVLLYELLTGRTPFDASELLAAGYDAVMRTIREEEPPKPSTRLTEDLVAADVRKLDSHSDGQSPKSEPDQASLRRLLQEVRGDLDWIVMKALEKDRQRRYDSAAAFAEDVQRHVRAEPVSAAAPSATYRISKFVRRNRLAVTATGFVALSLATATVVSLKSASAARKAQGIAAAERDRATLQEGIAEANAEESRLRLLSLNTVHGLQLLDRGDWSGAALWFCDALGRARTNATVQTANRLRLGTTLAYGPRLARLWFPGGSVTRASFSPDGRWVLAAGRDGFAHVWDIATDAPVGVPLRHAGAVLDAQFSPDGRFITTACEDRTSRVWEAATGKPLSPPMSHRLPLQSAAFTRGSRLVVTASGREAWKWTPDGRLRMQPASSEVRIWEPTTGRELSHAFGRPKDLSVIALSPTESLIAAAYDDGEVRILNDHLGQDRRLGNSASPASEGMTLVAPVIQFGATSAPTKFPLTPGADQNQWIVPHAAQVTSMAFSPDGKNLATAAADGSAMIHSLSGSEVARLQRAGGGRAGPVGVALLQVLFSPNNQRLATLARDGTVAFWSVPRGEAAGQLDSIVAGATSLLFSPDGRFVAVVRTAASGAGEVRLWEVASGRPAGPTLAHAGLVVNAAFNLDGTLLLTGSLDGGVRVWDLTRALPATKPLLDPEAPLARPGASPEVVRSQRAFFSPDAKRVATLAGDGTARVWAADAGLPVGPVIEHRQADPIGAFSRNGLRLAIGSQSGGEVRVFEVATGQAVSPPLARNEMTRRLVFTPDDRGLIIAGDKGVQVVEITSGAPLKLLVPPEEREGNLVFSSDGKWIATCAANGAATAGEARQWRVQVWEVANGQRVTPPLEVLGARSAQFADIAPALVFSDDGQWLAVSSVTEEPGVAEEMAGFITRVYPQRVRRDAVAAEPFELRGFASHCSFAESSHRLFLLAADTGSPIIRDLDRAETLPVRYPQERDFLPREVSRDGRWLLGSAPGGWRLWDVGSGEPVTPVLGGGPEAVGGDGQALSADGHAVLVGSAAVPQVWPITPDTRPLETVTREVQLLAARQLDVSGSAVPLGVGQLSNLWQSVRPPNPAAVPTASQTSSWHLQQAGQSEQAGQWFAAEFHLTRLLNTPADGPQVRQRLSRVRTQAAFDLLNRNP